MHREWEATIELTEQQAALLIEQQFPRLAPVNMVPLGIGWDNAAFLVNERFVFRFPRRKVAAGLLEREARILPMLAPDLPLRIPLPQYVGTTTTEYPCVFAGYALLPGRTACQFSCTDQERLELAPVLAGFLAALHCIQIGPATLEWAPRDEIKRADVRTRAPRVKEHLLLNHAELDASELQTLIDLVDDLATTPLHTGEQSWVHGDLYARHLLLTSPTQPVGVIDWGDVHIGDPALDLSIAWSFLPPPARQVFRRVYGPIDDATWNRARFRAIHYGALLVEYGTDTADRSIREAGEYALRVALR